MAAPAVLADTPTVIEVAGVEMPAPPPPQPTQPPTDPEPLPDSDPEPLPITEPEPIPQPEPAPPPPEPPPPIVVAEENQREDIDHALVGAEPEATNATGRAGIIANPKSEKKRM